MTCDEVREIFPALIAGDLGLTESAQAEAHLSRCPDCRQMIEDLYRVAPRRPARGRIPAHAETGPRSGLRFLLPPLLVLGLGLGAIALVPGLALHAWQRGTAMLAAARHEAPPAAPRAEAPPMDAARIESPTAPLTAGELNTASPSKGYASALSAPAPSLRGSTLAPPTSKVPTPPATVPPAAALTQPPATAAAPPADTPPARMTAAPAPRAPAPPVKAERPPEFSRRAAAHPPAETSSAPSAKKGERREARRTEKAPEPAEPERASKPASPVKASDTDVVVQVSVRDRGLAERDVKMLLTRLGGSDLGQDGGSTIAVIPRSSYAEFTRSLAQIGAWRMEAGRSNLPDPVHVAVRLAKPE
jgi:hypothetical protein